jgi:death-on-curing protein
LFQSLLMNHPFVDGNKRVAFFATDVFLRLNGWRLEVDANDAHAFIVGCLERNVSDYGHLVVWIRGAMRKIGKTT